MRWSRLSTQRLHRVLPGAARTLWVAIPVLVSAAGCSDEEWQAETYPATGQITINGEPPAGAVVELHATGEQPDVRNSRPWAIVDEDGTFTLTTYDQGDGAPPGDYAVTVKWPPDVSQMSLADRLGGAYTNSECSKWQVTIEEGQNELPPIRIEGAKVQSKEAARPPRRAPPGPGMQTP